MAGLLVVGELCPDIVVAGVPETAGRLRFGQAEDLVTDVSLALGSSAALTACAAARAGAEVSLAAVVGDDDLGRTCMQWVSETGVKVDTVRTAQGVPTGSSVILVSASDPNNRQILTGLGSMVELVIDDVPDHLLNRFDHLHVSSFFMHVNLRDRLHERFAAARAMGLTTSMDTNDDPDSKWNSGAQLLLRYSDALFCNDREALGLAGLPPGGDVEYAVSALLSLLAADRPADRRFPAVVHKQGELGATAHTPYGTVHVVAPQVNVVDTVGAGDALAGTVLAAIRSGTDWPTALAHGVAAASLSTTGSGGAGAQPSRDQVTEMASTLTVIDLRSGEVKP